MKVALTTAAGSLEVVEAPEPGIGDGEALIELIYCGFCGTDLYKLTEAGRPAGEVLGHEVVGRVVESRSTSLRAGDRVVAPHHAPCGDCRLCNSGAETMCARFADNLLDPGGFSERLRLKARAVQRTVRKLDAGLADEAAAFVEPAACVLRGVDRAGLVGETPAIVVIGAGSMGLLHLLVLRATLPDARILVAEPDPQRRAIALDLGADSATHPADLADTARGDLPEGNADAVFDTAGGQRAFDLALEVTRPGGRVVLFAHAARDARVTFDINKVFRSERQVIGAYSGSPAEQTRVLDLLYEGTLDPTPLVTHRLPLDRAAEAVDLCRRRAALKVLLHP
ncbi:MAG: alcohol dehydrogenase catalytic domain-containing protein [Acidobacteria bacterium]|nr:alcohol dehydrogenase catalytic domain-containing protein [Acidobacteriota bacterium]